MNRTPTLNIIAMCGITNTLLSGFLSAGIRTLLIGLSSEVQLNPTACGMLAFPKEGKKKRCKFIENLPERQQIHLYLRRQFPPENNPDFRCQKQTARRRGICVGFRRNVKGKKYLGVEIYWRNSIRYVEDKKLHALQKRRDGICRLFNRFSFYIISLLN